VALLGVLEGGDLLEADDSLVESSLLVAADMLEVPEDSSPWEDSS